MASPAASTATIVGPTTETSTTSINAVGTRAMSARQDSRTLELKYWDLKWRFDALPYEVQWPTQQHLRTGAYQCHEELEGKRSCLASLFAFMTDTLNKIDLELDCDGKKDYARKASRHHRFKEFDKALDEVKGFFDEVDAAVLTLELWWRKKLLSDEQKRLRDRIKRLNTFYSYIRSCWFAIDISVRETAKLDLDAMRLVIGAFEAPSSTTPPFETGMQKLLQDTPALMDADASVESVQYIEGWSNALNEQAAEIETYLCKLRAAVHQYRLVDEAVPKAEKEVVQKVPRKKESKRKRHGRLRKQGRARGKEVTA